ncbi:MAG: peptide deformylase [Chitinophagales bacterium]|nr:peptide deformylase [Chitinophagales bacterium]MDW8419493.1 peptide deformylase [Chitinophagales bacterium]
MVLPIVAYGDEVLRRVADNISPDNPLLSNLIDNMFETMDASKGVGLAAPQIGHSVRLFVVDSNKMYEDDDHQKKEGIRDVFINARLLAEEGDYWDYEEGCLSIPGIRENVSRRSSVTLEYYDRHFQKHVKTFRGYTARVIQHEYDHLEGILFIDHISPFRKRLLKRKLEEIAAGKAKVEYKMRFPRR